MFSVSDLPPNHNWSTRIRIEWHIRFRL